MKIGISDPCRALRHRSDYLNCCVLFQAATNATADVDAGSIKSDELNSSGIADNDEEAAADIEASVKLGEAVRPITSPSKTGAGKADEINAAAAVEAAPFEFMGDIPIDESQP